MNSQIPDDNDLVVLEGGVPDEYAASPSEKKPTRPDTSGLTSTKRTRQRPLDPVKLAAAHERAIAGDHYHEDSLSGFDGLDHPDKLSAQRSWLLYILLAGCCGLIILQFAIYIGHTSQPVKIIPSIAYTNAEVSTAIHRGELRVFAERLISRKNTWNSWSLDYARSTVVPYFAPEIAGNVNDQMVKEYTENARTNKRQICMIDQSIPGRVQNQTVYNVRVAYSIAEGYEKQGGKMLEHLRMSRFVADLDVIRVETTEENPDGLQVIRFREYAEDEYLRLGGDDVWEIMRSLGKPKKATP